MLFEFNGSFFDSRKLIFKRLFVEDFVRGLFFESFISFGDNLFFDENSLLFVELSFFGVEDVSNFSF